MPVLASLSTLPSFLAYFVGALALVGIFIFLYERFTPYREFDLIGAGNVAAAISLGGAVVGFAMPLASVIAHSVGWLDMIVWGVVALIVQILVYAVARMLAPMLVEHVKQGRVAPATTLAIASLTVGLLNAACITY
jgi:putative membrane protein